VESLQDFAVDYVVDGQPVMPHLREWSRDALRFTTVTDQTSEGRTSDAEFAALTSLLPIEHGAVAFRYAGNHYVGLPQVLKEHGYSTLSAVAFEPGFWNRDVTHPAYGFQRTLFEPDFTMTEQIGWGLNDRDFLQQMVPRLEQQPAPFCSWLITLSLHHPFEDFPDAHKVLRLGPLERTSFGNYLHTMKFFDDALEAFRQSLAADGLLARSVVVVFGDHDAGFPHNEETAREIGIRDEPAAWALSDRIPLFIRVPPPEKPMGDGGRAALTGLRDIVAGQTDFAPTLLALAGIDPAPLPYVGRNLLGTPDDPPVVRPYGDWLDRRRLFLAAAAGSAAACIDVAARRSAGLESCHDDDARAAAARDASRAVVVNDLQTELRRRIAKAAASVPVKSGGTGEE
jgi:phosphoglycerol transferase MdoB-like AlkP superfamily enzyme